VTSFRVGSGSGDETSVDLIQPNQRSSAHSKSLQVHKIVRTENHILRMTYP